MFDLLPSDNSICPKVNEMDGEVETFELMSAQKVSENIVAGEFKSSSALGMMDFFTRHGLFTADTNPHYTTICFELRKSLGWGQVSLGSNNTATNNLYSYTLICLFDPNYYLHVPRHKKGVTER